MGNKIHADNLHELDYNDINRAVANFAEELSMAGSNEVDVDLYRLLRNYLLNKDVRTDINAVLIQHRVY